MKKKFIIILFMILLLFYTLRGFIGNLKITYYQYYKNTLPEDLNHFRIVQLSDFHLKEFGKQQSKLISMIAQCEPNLIVLTGDMINKDATHFEELKFLLEGIHKLAPIYAVTGNHEEESPYKNKLRNLYLEYDVMMLENTTKTITFGNATLYLHGFHYSWNLTKPKRIEKKANEFHLLLFHDAQRIEVLSNFNYDMILCGHTHGGIVRLPFLGGIIGNHGDILPKYDYGEYQIGNTVSIVSSGLGNSNVPRFYNAPEIVCIELNKTK